MARRHRHSQHVSEAAGIAVSDHAGHGQDLRMQHRLAGDDSTQRRQRTEVAALFGPLNDEPVDVAAGEANLHPTSGHHGLVQVERDHVVEEPIEMGQRDVDSDPRHRDIRRRHVGPRRRSGSRPTLGQSQLLGAGE